MLSLLARRHSKLTFKTSEINVDLAGMTLAQTALPQRWCVAFVIDILKPDVLL